MDFYQIGTREIERGPKKGTFEIYPDFIVGRSKDLMVKGKQFYAVWDEERGLWSTDEYDIQRLVDAELRQYAADQEEKGHSYSVKYLRSFGSKGWNEFRSFLQNISDNAHLLDDNLTFANTDAKKSDYVSRRLPYPLAAGDHKAWDELVGTLYSPEEKAKIEWAIGAIVSGDSKKIQKFLVFYGPPGTGKSTLMDIVKKLFGPYVSSFDAKALGSSNNSFAVEIFRSNPLVAIDHDADMSKIEDNTKINSIVSHEDMTINEKNKPTYTSRINAFLMMGSNKPVKITDAKSGIIRRLIDVQPTGVIIPAKHYQALMTQIEFELGAIAQHCLDVYRGMGKNYYNGYRPIEMMLQTDIFFNFIEAYYDVFKSQEHTTLHQAYGLYKEFCADTGIERVLPQYKFREELRNYFEDFKDRATVDNQVVRSVYSGFNATKFRSISQKDHAFSLVLEESISLLDKELAQEPAQYSASGADVPAKRWSSVKTTLADIDTAKLHYVKVPENHIVIDFDLKNEKGDKSLERNLEAASVWPSTYAELSKSGAGVHLHYNYDGDTTQLDSLFSEGIEVKVFRGNASLRRMLSSCNAVPVATINSGLPIKEKKMLQETTLQSEKGLRQLIERNLHKEIHPGTKPSIDFIKKILDDAYESGMVYDVTDMRMKIMAFAGNSSNQSLECLKILQKMHFKSESVSVEPKVPAEQPLVFFDVEVYLNLFVVCWKYAGDPIVTRMINPSAKDVEGLFQYKLVGFNNRRYDNHILYAASLGYNLEGLYDLSQKLVSNDRNAGFGEAYNLSYTDIWDFSSKKQGLKKFEIELGIKHQEMDLPWDQPAPEDRWIDIADYCVNDVIATEAVFNSRLADFTAREILAELSGLSANATTQQHTARIIFQGDKDAAKQFVYTNLESEFPGYTYNLGKSIYREEEVGEGGYNHAEPGIYENVALEDVASMHPRSLIILNYFGKYTKNFEDLVEARLAIKAKDYAAAGKMFGGKLKPYLKDPDRAAELSYALKIAINIVYGLTSAKFDNPFRDPRNKDNIVAKRGALFMIDLKHYVQSLGFTVAHIKTDSIKIPEATEQIVELVMEFGRKYGYTFEHEATYDKFALVNDAVYIAQEGGKWSATGAQFAHPYVFKTLFSSEAITFDDLCETKNVLQGSMWLEFEHPMYEDTGLHFVGRTGRFVPVLPGNGGGILWRIKDGRQFAVTGTKGFLWMESDIARGLQLEGKIEIDQSYFDQLIDSAMRSIEKFGSYETLIAPIADYEPA